MKKLVLVLMMAMMVGACGESATDVATKRGDKGGDGGFIPPDTVIKTEDALVSLYRPGNPVAIASVQSLTVQSSFTGAIETAQAFGYGFDPRRVAVAAGRLVDGRDVVIALGSLVGNAGGHVLHIRVGDREETRALRLGGERRDGFEVLEIGGKDGSGPQRLFWELLQVGGCLNQTMVDLAGCYLRCPACFRACLTQALVRLVHCVQLAMI